MHPLVDQYEKRGLESGHVAANAWLRQTSNRMKLGQTGLLLDSPEEALTQYAKVKARRTERDLFDALKRMDSPVAVDLIRKLVERTGISFPTLPDDPTKDETAAALMRTFDESWWRRQLRTWQWSDMESLCRELGLVSKRKGIYISDFSFKRCQGQKVKNRRLLEAMEAENECGQVYSLAELSDVSVSNPENRRNELMVRMRGFEETAKNSDEQWCGMFYTLTCPSKYHATHQTGEPNSKFNGSSPKEANAYLNKVWQRVRSAWHRRDYHCFGFRVVEPHHDGTPHWHLMLFFPQAVAQQATDIFQRYALQEDGDEPGADQYRFKAVSIDPAKGSATGYIAKYISKNIDGHGIEADLYGQDASSSAARIAAWASLWGIRQFQQIGGPSVTVWRELRRLESKNISKELLKQITEAADASDWETYTRLMGGAICPRKERPIRAWLVRKAEKNQYGEFVKKLKGIVFGPLELTTRLHEWTVRVAQSNSGSDSEDAETTANLNASAASMAADFRAPPQACATLEFCQ
ncbi:replication endonuclease [Pseudomaricurvus alkylphenolicus]|uniref:replication endonuclease n=1 Tax=Pseudomaricurvus alkylphenolicus TaxID=1306991 RepID=UPI0014244F4A|nr:replication endonuclease [Pseudomaricurvus alkylphenolicus]NIB44804.1 replication endonuclease [Pseudomaricurvus alkylphenolicus]